VNRLGAGPKDLSASGRQARRHAQGGPARPGSELAARIRDRASKRPHRGAGGPSSARRAVNGTHEGRGSEPGAEGTSIRGRRPGRGGSRSGTMYVGSYCALNRGHAAPQGL